MKKLIKKIFGIKPNYAQISYSQQGEDLTLMRFFENRKEGFFVDVGAFHPIKYSNTYAFYKKGWRGINIEPNPDVQPEFNKIRPKDINLNIAIGNSTETLSYYKFNHPAVNSFSEEHVAKWKLMPGFELKEVIQVNTQRLDDVLKANLPAGQKIDFMSVDVESFDLEVLKSNDWKLYRPYLILAEEDLLQFNSFKDSPVVQFMESQNYAIHTICNGTLCFKDRLLK